MDHEQRPNPGTCPGNDEVHLMSAVSVITKKDFVPEHLLTHQEIRYTPEFYTVKDDWGRLQRKEYRPGDMEAYQQLLEAFRPKTQKASTVFTFEQHAQHWRGHVYGHVNGWSIILRRIPDKIPALRDLGFEPSEVTSLAEGRGIVLFGGPMGSGKSTTMASCVETLRRADKLNETITIEDPIEFRYLGAPYIEQREVGLHVNTYKDGVIEAMRQSKETIIIGEIRHPSTAEAAVQAGLTGHRVLATIHADSISECMLRMLSLLGDQYIELLPGALQGVMTQHMLRPKEAPPIPLYETMAVDAVTRSVLQGGPKSLSSLAGQVRLQHRMTMQERASDMVRKKFVSTEMVEVWLKQ